MSSPDRAESDFFGQITGTSFLEYVNRTRVKSEATKMKRNIDTIIEENYSPPLGIIFRAVLDENLTKLQFFLPIAAYC